MSKNKWLHIKLSFFLKRLIKGEALPHISLIELIIMLQVKVSTVSTTARKESLVMDVFWKLVKGELERRIRQALFSCTDIMCNIHYT